MKALERLRNQADKFDGLGRTDSFALLTAFERLVEERVVLSRFSDLIKFPAHRKQLVEMREATDAALEQLSQAGGGEDHAKQE